MWQGWISRGRMGWRRGRSLTNPQKGNVLKHFPFHRFHQNFLAFVPKKVPKLAFFWPIWGGNFSQPDGRTDHCTGGGGVSPSWTRVSLSTLMLCSALVGPGQQIIGSIMPMIIKKGPIQCSFKHVCPCFCHSRPHFSHFLSLLATFGNFILLLPTAAAKTSKRG